MLGMQLVRGILVWASYWRAVLSLHCCPVPVQKELGASESSPPHCIKKDPESTQSASRLCPEAP